jgi:glucosamine-phosphate N-acetyltransferase
MGILFSKQPSCNLIIRKIQTTDLRDQYLDLLSNLYENIDTHSYPYQQFKDFVNNLNDKHVVLVIEDPNEDIIVGTGTIIIEPKVSHNFGMVGHIEDVIILPDYQGLGIGTVIIEKLVSYADSQNCYKCILNCNDKNIPFYEKCKFSLNNSEMSYYFDSRSDL